MLKGIFELSHSTRGCYVQTGLCNENYTKNQNELEYGGRIMVEFQTERLIIRKFRLEDKEDIFDILSDEPTTLDEGGFHAFEKMNEEYQVLMERFETQERYSIVHKESNRVVGMINLQEDERAVKTYELGFVISPKCRRRGYAYEAITNMIVILFEKTDIKMFTVSHFQYNDASKKLIEKMGFVYEGIERHGLFHAAYGPTDLVCYYKEKKSNQ